MYILFMVKRDFRLVDHNKLIVHNNYDNKQYVGIKAVFVVVVSNHDDHP